MYNETEIEFSHTPVMLNECLDALNINPNGVYVDCTLGGAGHSLEIAKRLTNGLLIAIDKDDEALQFSKQKLAPYSNHVILVKSDFKNLTNILKQHGHEKVDGILADLGVSSHQIDTAERGFSYMRDGNLDMRMDKQNPLSAYDVVNTYSETDLANIIYQYGEEKFSRRIAKGIVEARKHGPIETTLQLTQLIEKSIPRKAYGKGNMSKKTFQALRIEVNGELNGLKEVVADMANSLKPNGRVAIITFHSLEDRIVKNVLKELSSDCICDKSSPICTCNHKASIQLVNKKPIVASENELAFNKRSASAKLRVAQKL